jgi:hypothetical protein
VVINEIMYHPTDFTGAVDDSRDEFIELLNITTSDMALSGWRLKGDAEYPFPTGATLPAGGYLLLVSFDPADTTTLAAFRAYYNLTSATPIFGPYSEKLANSTGDIEIAYPAAIGGFTRYINVDKVEYRDSSPWPTTADGGGKSLQRSSVGIIGNTAANWIGATPTPGALNAPYLFTATDLVNSLRWAGGLAVLPPGYVPAFDTVANGTVDLTSAVRIARKLAGLDANP